MGVFRVFLIVHMVPNQAKRLKLSAMEGPYDKNTTGITRSNKGSHFRDWRERNDSHEKIKKQCLSITIVLVKSFFICTAMKYTRKKLNKFKGKGVLHKTK